MADDTPSPHTTGAAQCADDSATGASVPAGAGMGAGAGGTGSGVVVKEGTPTGTRAEGASGPAPAEAPATHEKATTPRLGERERSALLRRVMLAAYREADPMACSDPPGVRPGTAMERVQRTIAVIPDVQLRKILKNIMTTAEEDFSEPVNVMMDQLLMDENSEPGRTVDAASLPRASLPGRPTADGKLVLWRGDITRLRIGAIVNAANAQMLGCFRVNHPCIDNAIHCIAGPRLRQACRRIMEAQGRLEGTAEAKITEGYCLPSQYVLHTVGPIAEYRGHQQPKLLGRCYRACLDLAKARGVRSVAFCGISTGMFGYPEQPAAVVAVRTVLQWLDEGDNASAMDFIMFNVFTDAATAVYTQLFRGLASSYGRPAAAPGVTLPADAADSTSTAAHESAAGAPPTAASAAAVPGGDGADTHMAATPDEPQ